MLGKFIDHMIDIAYIQYPYLIPILLAAALIFFCYRCYKCEDITLLFGLVSLKGRNAFKQLKIEFDRLNSDSKQKTNVIKFVSDFNREIARLILLIEQEEGNDYKEQQFKRFYAVILQSLTTVLCSCREDCNRAIIFVPDSEMERNLRVYESTGLSSEATDSLRLPYDESFAGKVFISGESMMSGDVTKSPYFKSNPKSNKEYNSLACVPIMIKNEVRGVLTIDAIPQNAFNKDSLVYLTTYANILLCVMILEQRLNNADNLNKEVAI